MPKLKEGTIIPTAAETAAIYAGIAADPDTFELTDEEFSRLKPMPLRGRPPVARPKIYTGLRLDGANGVQNGRAGKLALTQR